MIREDAAPRTERGRQEHIAWHHVLKDECSDFLSGCSHAARIAAIEAEAAQGAAAPPDLDVATLIEAFRESVTFRNIRAGMLDTEEVDCRGMALQIAHLYARLSGASTDSTEGT